MLFPRISLLSRIWKRRSQPIRTRTAPRFRLGVEGLETRDVPTGLTLSVALSNSSVQVGQPISISGSASTTNPMSYLGVSFLWGDGLSSSSGTAYSPSSMPSMPSPIYASHAYTTAGTYAIIVTATATYSPGVTESATSNFSVTVTPTSPMSPPPTSPPPVSPLPTVTIAGMQPAYEGGAAGVFQFTRTGNTGQPLNVSFNFSGTAASLIDYNVPPSFTIPAGLASANLLIPATDDTASELTETITLTLNATAEYGPGSPSYDSINLFDNDAPVVPPPTPAGTGTGLFGRYYNTQNLTEVKTARVDPIVFFDWGQAAPVGTTVGADNFSVRWTGKVEPRYSGAYTFHLTADDGVRLWVNGVQIVDKWDGAPNMPWQGTITLQAGQKYDIKLEYLEKTVTAAVKLEWSHAQQIKEVIPTTQLYPNTSTIGDFVWVDTDGNGRQDSGEPGAAGVKVRVLDALGADVVPAMTTAAGGLYDLVVPASDSYRLQFVPDATRFIFTAPLAWEMDVDSDADIAGYTAMFDAPSAGGTDPYKDAGLRPIRFDLDVNANGSLNDSVDLAANYLPGYEGDVQKISTGNRFNSDIYTGQRMKLILDGIGSNLAITKVVFTLSSTDLVGYASNYSVAMIEGAGKAKDYSFRYAQDSDSDSQIVDMSSTESTLDGKPFGGQIEATKTWVNFYCKDYGGAATVSALVYVQNGAGEQLAWSFPLAVPKDDDGDKIADKWEQAMYARGLVQYNEIRNFTLAQFSPNDDKEAADPDGTGPLVSQAEEGDAHTVLEEYRGYILDGGGFDGAGANGFTGGHIRLDPNRKEILLEVDEAATLNNVPAGGLPWVLNGASKVFSNATRGAGIYMYYLTDEVGLDLLRADVDDDAKRMAALQASRDTANARTTGIPNLTSDFIHLLIVDDSGAGNTGAVTYDLPGVLAKRGSFLSVTNMFDTQAAFGLDTAKFDERMMTTTAHEITHLLFERTDGPFNASEHTKDPNGNGMVDAEDETDLMYQFTKRGNRELATVKFFPVVQIELKVKSNQAFVV